MNWRYLFLLSTASLLLPIGSAVAFSQIKSASIGDSSNSSTLIAQMPPCPPPRGEAQRGGTLEPPWAKDLNLSTEQRDRIKTLHEQAKKDIEGVRQQLMEADRQMRSLLASDTSSDQLRQQHQQIETLHQQLDNKRFEMMLAEREVLTPEQRSQLGKLMPPPQAQPLP